MAEANKSGFGGLETHTRQIGYDEREVNKIEIHRVQDPSFSESGPVVVILPNGLDAGLHDTT